MQIITEDDGSRWLSLDGDMSTTTLWHALEAVLREKGATDAWLAYALPDLHTAATQLACHEFTRGYRGGERGTGCGAYDPPRVGSDPSLQELADQDQAEYEDMREAFQAGYKYGNELDRGADLSDHCFAEWMGTQIVETDVVHDFGSDLDDDKLLDGFGPAEGLLGGNS